jgi:hypothetical protein
MRPDNVPRLRCPECCERSVPATTRGRTDRDGNFIDHGPKCRCRWCGWVWEEPSPPVRCGCGALLGVRSDGESAYVETLEEP